MNKLENYDAGEIAKIATYHGLYEEALTIYKKYDQHAMAINVLVEHIVSIDRGFDYEVWSRIAKAQLDGLRIKDSIGMQYFALSLNLELTFLFCFWQTRTSRLKIRPTSPKSSKSQIVLESMTTLFASFKWLTNLFVSRELIRSWHMCMPRPIACTTWRTSLAWWMSWIFWKSEKNALRMSFTKLPNCSSPASQIGIILLPCLSTWAKTKPQSRVLGKPEIPSELFHVLSQSWCW